MQMRTFLLRALVLLLIALATESVKSDEDLPLVTELPEESGIESQPASAKAPIAGETKTILKEQSLVQFGTGLGIGDALGLNPPPPPKMPPAVKAYMPLEADPGEVMPPVAQLPSPPTPGPTYVWEDTPLPDPIAMDTMPIGWDPSETMPPPVMASEDREAKGKGKKASQQKETRERSESMPPPVEKDTLLEETLTATEGSIPAPAAELLDTPIRRKKQAKQARQMPQMPGDHIWDINMEANNHDWEPDVIQKRIVQGMPKVPLHKLEETTKNPGLNLARHFGQNLQAFFQRIYHSAHNTMWGDWTPKWAKYRSGIFSVFFALTVAVAPVFVLLFVTLTRYVGSKLCIKSKNAPADTDTGKNAPADTDTGGMVETQGGMFEAQSDAVFYTSRMFPVD